MHHTLSDEDFAFQASFESCEFPPAEFDHGSHVRLAYLYLCSHGTDTAQERMQSSLLRFLKHNGVDPLKYQETLTRAWILAIRYFMEQVPVSDSAESFMGSDPRMLDPDIMLTHYSASLLFSDEARQRFVEPNLSPIPRFGD